MFNPLATNRTKYQEPAHSGAPPDFEGSKQPALSGTPYTPSSEKPALPEPPLQAVCGKAHAGGSLQAAQRHIGEG